ncbi:uncharacterized protein [Haliotis asinina]|uniref:uncharacterized protein n=1 Tax=Haliotis asinina TaxID=109174 RepID=UPI00353201BF
MRHKGDNSCEIEERLARAAETSLKTKSISPVLREELRLSILNRRHANGQEELAVEFKEPVKHELTPAEIEKKVRRREQNRRAARRCREKKKRNQEGTFEGLAKVIEENQSLEAEINLLKSQKDAIKRFLDSHGVCGSVKQEAVDIMSSVVGGSVVTDDGTSRRNNVAIPSQLYDASVFVQPDQTVSEITDSLPQAVVDFCLEHSTKDESLFFDCGSDMRRQTVSVSSVSSEADVFGMESDTDTVLTNDQSGLSECSEDEDVFQQCDVWGISGTHALPLMHDNQSCLSLSCFGALCSQISSNGSDDASYMTYLNLSEP